MDSRAGALFLFDSFPALDPWWKRCVVLTRFLLWINLSRGIVVSLWFFFFSSLITDTFQDRVLSVSLGIIVTVQHQISLVHTLFILTVFVIPNRSSSS